MRRRPPKEVFLSHSDQHIVPVVLRKCRPDKLSWVIDQFEFVEFVRRFDDGCEELLRIWSLGPSSMRRDPRRGSSPRGARRRAR